MSFQVWVDFVCFCFASICRPETNKNEVALNFLMKYVYLKKKLLKPWPVWLRWLEHYLVHGKAEGLFNSQSTHIPSLQILVPLLGHLWEVTVSVSLTSMFLSHSKIKTKIIFKIVYIPYICFFPYTCFIYL